MKLDFKDERVLAVVAHPDDAELLCAGTLARALHDGAEIAVCVMCQGDKGQSIQPIPNLPARRRKELKEAIKLLGAELFTEENPDSRLEDSTANRASLTEIYRQFRPTLILAHSIEDYHPDHRAAGMLAESASWFSASHGFKTSSPPIEKAPALWWMDTVNMSGFSPEFYIDITEYTKLKTRMLECHASQLQRGAEKNFSPLGELMTLQYRARGLQAGVEAAEAFRAHLVFKRGRAW
jgi:LmbE family N-acetylglucosaminyl deacetylase